MQSRSKRSEGTPNYCLIQPTRLSTSFTWRREQTFTLHIRSPFSELSTTTGSCGGLASQRGMMSTSLRCHDRIASSVAGKAMAVRTCLSSTWAQADNAVEAMKPDSSVMDAAMQSGCFRMVPVEIRREQTHTGTTCSDLRSLAAERQIS